MQEDVFSALQSHINSSFTSIKDAFLEFDFVSRLVKEHFNMPRNGWCINRDNFPVTRLFAILMSKKDNIYFYTAICKL